jgi:hypothetical protein
MNADKPDNPDDFVILDGPDDPALMEIEGGSRLPPYPPIGGGHGRFHHGPIIHRYGHGRIIR